MHMREVLESYTKSDSFHSVSSPLNPALKLAGLWWDSYYYPMISTIRSRNHISMSSAAITHIFWCKCDVCIVQYVVKCSSSVWSGSSDLFILGWLTCNCKLFRLYFSASESVNTWTLRWNLYGWSGKMVINLVLISKLFSKTETVGGCYTRLCAQSNLCWGSCGCPTSPLPSQSIARTTNTVTQNATYIVLLSF